MITLAIWVCHFLIILAIAAVWELLVLFAAKFCASNNQP